MKTLTIFVRNSSLVFELLGVPYDEGCPRIDGLQWWRGWDFSQYSHDGGPAAALSSAPGCVLQDVIKNGVTDIEIVSSHQSAPGFAPSKLACGFYDAVQRILSSPPDGTPSYQVTLQDVKNPRGAAYYPARPAWFRYGAASFLHVPGPKANLQNMPRKVGKVPELAAAYAPNLQDTPSPDVADALALTFATPAPDFYAKAFNKFFPEAAYEKLEARVTALETARRADWWTFRKNPAFLGTMYGGPVKWPTPVAQNNDGVGPVRTHYWVDESTAVPLPKKTDYSKMVLRIGITGLTGLCLPHTPRGSIAAAGTYAPREAEALALKLRQLKVRELTLRRHSGAPMERMTEWLVAIVNASSPVMKIISDPEMMK